jgi:hypothetical protein
VHIVSSGCAYGVVARANHTAVAGDRHTSNAYVVLGDQLVRALVLAQVPDAHIPPAVTANQLALVRVNNDIVHGDTVSVVSLHVAAARVPDLDGAVLRRRHEPLALAVERHARNVGRVPVERQDRIGVRRLDVIQLDCVVARGGEVAFVGGDA